MQNVTKGILIIEQRYSECKTTAILEIQSDFDSPNIDIPHFWETPATDFIKA